MVIFSAIILFLLLGSGKAKYRTDESTPSKPVVQDSIRTQPLSTQSLTTEVIENDRPLTAPLPSLDSEIEIEMDTLTALSDTTDEESIPIPLELLSRAETLNQRLDEWISKPGVSKANWGLRFVRLNDGKVLYERNGSATLKPASNTKLFTVAAAYELLGADFRYRTSFIAKGEMDKEGTLFGDLEVHGSGDPTQSSIYHGEESNRLFFRIADSLVAKGLRKVQGSIVVKREKWAESGPPPGWMWEDVVEGYGSSPELVMYQDNCYEITILPGERIGDSAIISVLNDDDSSIDDFLVEAITVPAHSDEKLMVVPSLQTGERRVVGSVALAAKQRKRRVVRRDPYTSWKINLENALRAKGVMLSNPTQPKKGKKQVPIKKTNVSELRNDTLFTLYSLPLKDISRVVMKLSHNPSSEALLRTIGYVKGSQWTTEKGRSIETKLFKDWGLDDDVLYLHDGSGLSHATYVSANVVTDLLQVVSRKPWFSHYYENLPYAGEPNSTLSRRRLLLPDSVEIRAKTGTISGVITLSGYVTTPRDTIAFSILCNNYPPGTRKQRGSNLVKATQNGLLTEVAWTLAPQGPRRKDPIPESFPIPKRR